MMLVDYYAMLGVDPGADRGTLEAALARNQPIWSSGTRNPKNKHTYQSYLDQIPALRQTLLGDLSARAAYDAELAAARRAARDETLDALQRLIRLRAAKGGLTVGDRALLRDQAVKLGLTAADLDRLAEPIPPKPEAPAEDDTPDPPADVIDPAARRQIRVALDHLRHRDFYDALGLPRDAPAEEITARADAERQRWMQKAQVTAEKTARLEVVSLAQSHLTTPAARARYDRTLALGIEETLRGSIEFALKGLSRLDPGTLAALLEEATTLGIRPDRADRLIGRACRALGVARDAAPLAATAVGAGRLLRCRSCSGVTDFAKVSKSTAPAECRHCRASLRWDCPACQRSRWVDESRCPCGFRLEHLEPLVRHFEAAQQAFKAREPDAALAHLRRVQEFAPQHVGARKGIEKVRDRLAETARARTAWEAARAGGQLVAARAAVLAWGRLVNPALTEWQAAWSEVSQALREAQTLANRARTLAMTDPKAARDGYRQSLAIAADLPDALNGLKCCPPDPPSGLRAEFVEGRVRLRWNAPAPDGLGPLTFVIARKTNGWVAHPGDGTRIAELAATEFEDTHVTPGEVLGYAVWTRRGETESLTADSHRPMFLLGEVTDVRVEARSREVDLSWTLPARAIGVRVVRKLGVAPTGPEDGDRIEALRDQAHDRGLEDDRVYHYGLFAVYRTPDGNLRPSRGTFVSVQPHPPVQALAAPRLTPERDGRIRLDWRAPARGSVKILRSARAIPHAAGDRLSLAQVQALEGHWLEAFAPDQAYDPSPPALGVCHYTPLTAWSGSLTVGHGVSFSCVPDPSDLRATRVGNGGRIRLRWRWSPQGSQALVVARSGSAPLGPDDPLAQVTTVQEGEYSRQGQFTLTLPPGDVGPWHVCVYSLAMVDGQSVVSPGLDPTSRTVVPGPHPEVTVSYTFRRPGFPGRPWSLLFRTEPAGASIPPTALVAHPRTVPLSVDDGEILDQFPATRDGATFPIRARIDLSRHRARIFADPRCEPEGLAPIRLRHPETNGTRA